VKNLSNTIHDGVSTAAHIYNAVAPTIKHYLPHHAKELHHTVSSLASGYNSLRDKAMEAHSHINTIGGKLGGLV
jgi:hypothetical protein